MATRQEVYAAIDSEREYQMAMAERAHGDPSNDKHDKGVDLSQNWVTKVTSEPNNDSPSVQGRVYCQDEGCPNHGIPHYCNVSVDHSPVDSNNQVDFT